MAVLIIGAVAAIVSMLIAAPTLKGANVSAQTASVTEISNQDLASAAGERVFFGHQSVGMNVLDGVPLVYEAHGMATPPIISTPAPSLDGGFIEHAYIGENTKPQTKIVAFDAAIRGGVAERADVAFMKLCFVDFNSDTDVEALFAQYRETMAALERDYPDVTFLHVTTPLTTESGWKAQIKRLLGRPDANRADNVVREQYNSLMRQEYGDNGRLFDLAALESTTPDGTRVTGQYEGSTYYALAGDYASDSGHLNALGSSVAAAELLELIAREAGD
ncbi:MAG: hypothetical protein WCF12_15620 [Propionicimonas sp.]